MAIRYSIGTGDFTTAGTWGTIDATSYLNTETAVALTTSYVVPTAGGLTSPGALTISHILVKLANRTGTTGTIRTAIYSATGTTGTADAAVSATATTLTETRAAWTTNEFVGATVTCNAKTMVVTSNTATVLTGASWTGGTPAAGNSWSINIVQGTATVINMADLPAGVSADLNGGWIAFKLAAPVTTPAAAIGVVALTSSASQCSLFGTATTNLSRALVTTTTGAPAAGDDHIVAEERTGAGTANAFTVTNDSTATTDYGSAATSLVTPSLAVCDGGTFAYGTTAATNYYLRQSGNIIVYAGGIFNMGTTGTPCPRDSTMKLNIDCGANVDFGFVARNLATVNIQGQSRTSGKNIYMCRLNTDEAIAQTVLGVDTDTGWLNGDVIGIAATSRTPADTESRTLSGDAGASSITVTAGLTNAHSGTSPNQAEVILLTRNVSIFGVSTTVQTYIDIKATANVDADWAEFYFMGSATTAKRGIDMVTTTGSASFSYCSFHDFAVTSSIALNMGGAGSGNNFTAQHCVFYNVQQAISMSATVNTSWTIDNIYVLLGTGAGAVNVVNLNDIGGTITNIYVVGCTAGAVPLNIAEVNTIGTISDLYVRSCSAGITLNGFLPSSSTATVSNITVRRTSVSTGLTLTNMAGVTLDNVTLIANTTSNLALSSNKDVTITNSALAADSSFATTNGVIVSASAGGNVTFENTTFGVGTKHTNDIVGSTTNSMNIALNNCLLDSTTEVSAQSSLSPGIIISSQKHDQTAGLHKSWQRYGTITIDTTAGLYDVTPSIRLTPNNASFKLDGVIFRSAVSNGNTLNVSVKVRESVVGDGTDYNGNRIRLVVKKNVAAGISADTVLATATVASVGAFEAISGTTAAVTDDAILEFGVDCDGTTGWINADTWTVASQDSTLGLKYWKDGTAYAYGDNSTGGGSSGNVGYGFSG